MTCWTDLVERIIKTLIEILQVQQNDCLPSLHAHLYPIDVSTHLEIRAVTVDALINALMH